MQSPKKMSLMNCLLLFVPQITWKYIDCKYGNIFTHINKWCVCIVCIVMYNRNTLHSGFKVVQVCYIYILTIYTIQHTKKGGVPTYSMGGGGINYLISFLIGHVRSFKEKWNVSNFDGSFTLLEEQIKPR